MTRRTWLPPVVLLAVVVATPFAAHLSFTFRQIPERIAQYTHPVTFNPFVAFGLLPLGLLFAVVCAMCLSTADRLRRWSGVGVVAWAVAWSFASDAASRLLYWTDKALCRQGIIPSPAGNRALTERIEVHVPIALAAASLVTAFLLWNVTRSRMVLVSALAATPLVATVLFDWPVSFVIWSDTVATVWMAMVAGSLIHWAVAARKRAGPEPRCSVCSYDLTGNTTGICPECGKAVGA